MDVQIKSGHYGSQPDVWYAEATFLLDDTPVNLTGENEATEIGSLVALRRKAVAIREAMVIVEQALHDEIRRKS